MTMATRFVFDANRCTGCQACIIACSIENRLEPSRSFRQVHSFNDRRHPQLPCMHLSMACNHCADPPCLKNCPTGAYMKDTETGAVFIDGDICIGCKYCTLVCPYDAPQFNPESGYTEKCDFCLKRLQQQRETACVQTCPTGALNIESYDPLQNDAHSSTMPGFSDTPTQPAVRIKGWIPDNHCVYTTAPVDSELASHFTSSIPSNEKPKTSLATEWPLLIFTSLAALQVALMSAFVISDTRVNLWIMLGSGLLNMTLTTAHLGKKHRAYRANKNIINSWLSREILLYGLFLGASSLALYISESNGILGMISLIIGVMLLISIDAIYAVIPLERKPILKGADVIVSSVIYGFLLNGYLMPALVLAGIRSICFAIHSRTNFLVLTRIRWPVVMLRMGLGVVCPMTILLMISTDRAGLWLLVCMVFAEIVERFWFYLTLDVLTPNNQMSRDFTKAADRVNTVNVRTPGIV